MSRAVRLPAESLLQANALPYDLVRESASSMACDKTAVDRLSYLLTNPGQRQIHPMVASILHALNAGWKAGTPAPRLAGAYLQEADWPEIDLTRADLQSADLSRSNLRGSRLDSANLENGNLVGAELGASSLLRTTFKKADLTRASLESVPRRNWSVSVSSARSRELGAGQLRFFKLRRCRPHRRMSRRCEPGRRRLAIRHAQKRRLFPIGPLTGDHARALPDRRAVRRRCNSRVPISRIAILKKCVLPGAVFAGANLNHALLTGSRMPGADFSKANLRAAGLAEIDWEGADLREADLRQAAFHLGSSRSGLVGSPIACEGSRTGFYTDDWNEQDYKSPEEIRKANLCGADLRGAKIDERGFLPGRSPRRPDRSQANRTDSPQSGAILEARV